jgi:hypothetical protein
VDRHAFLKILLSEREHHFRHPHEVGAKIGFSLFSGVVALLIAGVLGNVTFVSHPNPPQFYAGILLFLTGTGIAAWGLREHDTFHARQRRRLEDAIELLIRDGKEVQEIIDEAWSAELGGHHVPLLVAEPDRRSGWAYHDTKLALGLVIQVAATVLLVIAIAQGSG